jgi:SAM-dependent methyltransferase
VTHEYIDSMNPQNVDLLRNLQTRMHGYYQTKEYHEIWVKGANSDWNTAAHKAQIELCQFIPPGSSVLEVGCGDGRAGEEVCRRVKNLTYTGLDLHDARTNKEGSFSAGSAEKLPFLSESVHVVLSFFVIEHLVFPARFLDEAWRVLAPAGRLLTIAPDFSKNGMQSERIGFSYGSGRDKLKKGKILDTILTAYDSRFRIPLLRKQRRRELHDGKFNFPILSKPRCLQLSGFINDCDAIYPSCPEEMINYLSKKDGYASHRVFYRDNSTFGLLVEKRSAAVAS